MVDKPDLEKYYELSYYTLAHRGSAFLHQHIVDAFTAQTADENTKPIAVIFSLAGLYLYVEKGYTGRQVQKTHMEMANKRKKWQSIALPEKRGKITVSDVLSKPEGDERDNMIKEWCISVWQAYEDSHQEIASLVDKLIGY